MYLDSAPVIYLIERHSTFGPRTAAWLAANATTQVSSELTRLECLVRPARLGQLGCVQDFENFFAGQLDLFVGLTRPVFDRAVQVRATYPRFKTPDALHLATAVEAGCDVFLTNDHQLKQFTGITVEVV